MRHLAGRLEEVYADGGQLRVWEFSLKPLAAPQSRLSSAGQKHIVLQQVLIGKTVSSVVCDRQRPVEVGRGKLRRQGVKLQNQQAKPSDIGRPSAQVAHHVLLHFIRWNLLAEVCERPGCSRLSRTGNIVGGWKIGPIVV